MKFDYPNLFLEINEEQIIFLVVKYNEDLEFTVLDTTIINSGGILNGKIIDINVLSKLIKDTLYTIEKKIDHIFNSASVVIDHNNINCINISGYKKISGSQVLEQDISYILNDIKKTIMDKEPNYSLIHLFNSAYTLDGENVENMPIGLYGDFYNHHLTCFLILKNDIKNLKQVLNNSHINIEKVILKPFAQNINKLKKEHSSKPQFFINLNIKKSDISIFNNLSFIYHEKFNFGTDIIIQDVSKVCSLKIKEVENIISKINLSNLNNNQEYLTEEYFIESTFRKISLKHIEDIISARLEEMVNIIYKKNINLTFLKKKNHSIDFSVKEIKFFGNIHQLIQKSLSQSLELNFSNENEYEPITPCLAAAELLGKGWEKEAIPIIQTKKSLITRIFTSLFH
jgi:cell division protein FtsA